MQVTRKPASKDDSPAGSALRSGIIGNVEVRLEAWLGEARLTVAALEALEAGAVVPLETTLADAVELRLNGVLVGKGELVSVGDRFGVRLTELMK